MGPSAQFKEIWLNMGLGRMFESRKNTSRNRQLKSVLSGDLSGTNATLPVTYNDALEVIVVVAKRLETCPRRYNFV